MLEVYENIKKLRKLNGWTQDDLSKKLGYSDRSIVSKIEHGHVDLNQSQIINLAKIFRVSPGMLFGSLESDFKLSAFEKDIICAYRAADPGTQSSILKLLDLESDSRKKSVSVS